MPFKLFRDFSNLNSVVQQGLEHPLSSLKSEIAFQPITALPPGASRWTARPSTSYI